MRFKKLRIIILLLIVLTISVNAVCADDNLTSIEDDSDALSVDEKTFDDISAELETNDSLSLEGTYKSSGSEINIGKSVTIDGNNKTVLDGNNEKSAIFTITADNVNIKNLKFINSKSKAINIKANNLVLENCEFINICNDYYGGAINSFGNNLTIKNCIFSNSTSIYSGGAICTYGDGLTIENSFFDNNRARNGGALYISGDNAELTNNTFTNNYANTSSTIYWTGNMGKLYGGLFESNTAGHSIFEEHGTLTVECNNVNISNVTFRNNKGNCGGAIRLNAKNGCISNIYCENNTAEVGGALRISGDGNILKNSIFIKNQALTSDGGAIIWEGKQGLIYNSSFIENKADSALGGAIESSMFQGEIDNCTFDKNHAHSTGAISGLSSNSKLTNSIFTQNSEGAVTIYADNVYFANLTFDANYITNNMIDGTALYLTGNDHIIENVNFTNNRHKNGEIVSTIGDNFRFINCNFINNTGTALLQCYGVIDGCRFISNNGANTVFWTGMGFGKQRDINNNVIRNSVFENNKAKNGVIEAIMKNQCVIHCNFTNNIAENGGAIYWTGENPYITNNIFSNNKATKMGGALYLYALNAYLKDNKFINNNAPSYKDIYGYFEFKINKKSFYYGEKIIVTVTDKTTNKPVSDIDLEFWIDTLKPVKTIVESKTKTKNGKATFDTAKVKVGKFTLNVLSRESVDYFYNGQITIKKSPTTVKAPNVVAKVKKSKIFKITVTNKITKDPVKKIALKVKIGKKTYTLKTDKNGVAKFNTNKLKVGTYNVKITTKNNNYQISAKSKIKIKR